MRRYAGGAQPITRAASDGSVRDVHWGIGQIGVTLTKCRRIASPALQRVQRACLGGVRVFSRSLPSPVHSAHPSFGPSCLDVQAVALSPLVASFLSWFGVVFLTPTLPEVGGHFKFQLNLGHPRSDLFIRTPKRPKSVFHFPQTTSLKASTRLVPILRRILADLGVTRSLSRPQVSDDNPFSEAQFKTLKYHPPLCQRT